MVKKLAENAGDGFEWIDVIDPNHDEIQQVAREYQLHETAVNDCLQPDHLPKFEMIDDYAFMIFRLHAAKEDNEADTVQELTDKIALFISKKTIISVRKKGWFNLEEIRDRYVKSGICRTTFHLENEIIKAGLMTYNEPALLLTRSIEHLEENVFLRNRKFALLKQCYFIKRKIDVIRRILILTYDIVDHIDSADTTTTYTRDTRDLYIRLQNIYDSLSENTNHFLNIYFNISAQKTNEIIRVLTIFSVFFMPLTFIVGIYGMNFDFMPELKWRLGYPAVLISMVVVTAVIYWWFKKKGWL